MERKKKTTVTLRLDELEVRNALAAFFKTSADMVTLHNDTDGWVIAEISDSTLEEELLDLDVKSRDFFDKDTD